MLNGRGLRVVLWVAGCGHACPGCHNPITWDAQAGLIFDQTARDELFNELKKDYISGVTFSGGDPLFPENRAEIESLSAEIRRAFPQKNIWLYTGYLWEEIETLPLMQNIDVVVDGRFIQAQADSQLHWRGSANQRLIDVQQTFSQHELILLDENA